MTWSLASVFYGQDMNLRYADSDLERLESNPKASAGLSAALVRVFLKRIWFMKAAVDERDFRSLRSLRFENGNTTRFERPPCEPSEGQEE